jgi:phytoene synthase
VTVAPTSPSAAPSVPDAYATCEQITRREAANFFYGIRLLRADKRHAMSAVYAFARRVDDIGDGTLPTEDKVELLAAERAGVDALRAGATATEPVFVALADATARFDLPLDALEALIDGVEQDVRGERFGTFEDLRVYCGRVAGAVGRLCVAIFGARDRARAMMLADELGVAMQLTNILRDVREDSLNGRVYLPQEDLERFGCAGDPLAAPPAALEQLIRFEAERNREWFARGLQLLPLLDRRSASCVLAMTGIYRRILDRIEADPLQVTRHRISLPTWEKAALALRSLTGIGR